MKKNPTSLVAVALVSVTLTACSSNPIVPDSTLGKATDRIGAATETIAQASERLWQRTRHVLRLDEDTPARPPRTAGHQKQDEFMDEVDLALMEEGLPEPDATSAEIKLASAEVQHAIKVTEVPAIVATPADTAQVSLILDGTTGTDSGTDTGAIAQTATPAIDDYLHVVDQQEILWDIAKKVTGDATNWQTIAQLNELDANGSVYPGQTLSIPADMVKPELLPGAASSTVLASADETVLPSTEPTTDTTVASTGSRLDIPTRDFTVQAGESLWSLAKRTTGDATNWKMIADANGMSDEDAGKIYYGQPIAVPEALIDIDSTTLANSPAPNVKLPAPQEVGATDTAIALNETQTQPVEPLPTDKDITIMEASFKADPPNLDSETATEAVAATVAAASTNANPSESKSTGSENWIMISGTYYPKAVYNDANFSATLLMRVSPGTRLEVLRTIGPWFEVSTDRGVGYVHSRDTRM